MFNEQKILDQLNIKNNSELCRILNDNLPNTNIAINFDPNHNYYRISGKINIDSEFFELKKGLKFRYKSFINGDNNLIIQRIEKCLQDKKFVAYKEKCHRGHLIGKRFKPYIDIKTFNFSENNPKNIYPQWINANDNNLNNSGILGQAYFEEQVLKWLERGKEVLYKVVPIFEENNKDYPIGNVIIAAKENAKKIDDSGNYLSYVFDEDQTDHFCVFIPNYLDTDVVVIRKKRYIMNNMKRDGEDVINKGYWYIPKNDISEIDNISYKDIKEISQLQINISDNDGNFDDYLASLILELPYIQSVSNLYRDNADEYILEEKLQRLDNIDKIHNDIVFIKKLFYKGLYHLNKLKENINSEQKFEENEDVFDYREFYYFIYNDFYHFSYMYRIDLSNIFGINILLEYDDDFVERYFKNQFGNLSMDNVNNLINVWVAVFCIELNIKTAITDPEYIFGNNILKNNIDAVELELGSKQIQCCFCYRIFNKNSYEDFIAKTPRIFRFISYLTRNNELKKQYFIKKAKRCYSQMWIDGCETQYFALSCGPSIEKKMEYYKIAEEILNSFQNHSKYESALCTGEMRYYYSNQANDYVTYSEVKSNQIGLPLSKMFSCCERKLLTIIEKYKNKESLNHKTVHMCIKYSPCQICDRGLNAYEKNGVKFEIIAPGNRMDKNKFLEVDKKIKDILVKKQVKL